MINLDLPWSMMSFCLYWPNCKHDGYKYKLTFVFIFCPLFFNCLSLTVSSNNFFHMSKLDETSQECSATLCGCKSTHSKPSHTWVNVFLVWLGNAASLEFSRSIFKGNKQSYWVFLFGIKHWFTLNKTSKTSYIMQFIKWIWFLRFETRHLSNYNRRIRVYTRY